MKALAARLPRRALIVLALALLISLFAVHPAAAQVGTGARIEAEVLSVRTGPGGGFDLLATAAKGDIVILLGRTADSSWLKIQLSSGVEGWASSYYITPLAGPFLTLPVLATAEPQAQVIAEVLNVRSGASFLATPIGVVRSGEFVNLLGRDHTDAWLYIRSNSGLIGWVASGSVAVDVPFASLPVLTGTTAAITTPATTTTTTAPTAAGASATSTQFQRIGSGPRNTSDTVTFIDGGEEVTLLARNDLADWVYIQFHGDSLGWAETPYFTTTIDVNTLPVLSEGQTPTGEHLASTVIGAVQTLSGANQPTTTVNNITFATFGPTAFVTAEVANVRTGPDPVYPAIATVSQGQVVAMVGRDQQSAWIQVAVPGTSVIGWVSSALLQPNALVLSLPVTAQAKPSGMVTAAALNVRSGPGLWYPPVAIVVQGQYVELTGRLADSTWLKVVVNGQEGWVASGSIVTNYPLNNLPVYQVY